MFLLALLSVAALSVLMFGLAEIGVKWQFGVIGVLGGRDYIEYRNNGS